MAPREELIASAVRLHPMFLLLLPLSVANQ